MTEPTIIVWRPSWRPAPAYLIAFGALGVVAAALTTRTSWLGGRVAFSLLVTGVLLGSLALKLLLGRTDAETGGPRNRLITRTTTVPWRGGRRARGRPHGSHRGRGGARRREREVLR